MSRLVGHDRGCTSSCVIVHTDAQRIYSRLAMAGACWVWTGPLTQGYGEANFSDAHRHIRVHRWVYTDQVGPIPADREIDHLCRNRACALPAHLELVTTKENVLRGNGLTAQNARATTCKEGHPFEGDNLVRQPGNRRGCRICVRRRSMVQYYRRKQRTA